MKIRLVSKAFLFLELLFSILLITFISSLLTIWYFNVLENQMYYKEVLNSLNVATALVQDPGLKSIFVGQNSIKAVVESEKIYSDLVEEFYVNKVKILIKNSKGEKELILCSGYCNSSFYKKA